MEISVDMIGPSKNYAQGKTTQKQSTPINLTFQRTDFPKTIRKLYNDAELSAEDIHLNDLPFLTSISEGIHYGTVGAADNLKCATLENELKIVISDHYFRGFRAEVVQEDVQFKALKDMNLVGVAINKLSRDEHVKNIEKSSGN